MLVIADVVYNAATMILEKASSWKSMHFMHFWHFLTVTQIIKKKFDFKRKKLQEHRWNRAKLCKRSFERTLQTQFDVV